MFQPKIKLGAFYNAVMKARGFSLGPHHMPICVALEDQRIDRLMVVTGPGNGKSTITSTVFPAWQLGHAPETTILGIGAAEHLMQGFSQSAAEIIANNPVFREMFPNVGPDKKAGWSNYNGYNVTGRPPGDPDASYLGVGLASKALTGKHGRLILLDDLHDKENSMTAEGCARVVESYYNTIQGRADPRGARYILSGRRFNTADIYGHFIGSGDWTVMILPAERQGEKRLWWDVLVPKDEDGKPVVNVLSETLTPLPDQDPDKRTVAYRYYYGLDKSSAGFYWPGNVQKRKEYFQTKRNAPYTAEAVYQCNPGVRENAVFVDDDFCFDHPFNGLPLHEGRMNASIDQLIDSMGGDVVQAWDTGFGKSADSAYTVGVTALLVPYREYWRGEDPELVGEPDRHNRVFILDVFREKLDFAQLSSQLRVQYRKWSPRLVLIENRASGISLLQTLKSSSIPVEPVATKEGKVARATDAVGGGAGSVQGWFRQHRVVLPAAAPWLAAFVAEFKDFSGTQTSFKDQVDATVHLVAYAISRSIGAVRFPSESVMTDTPAPQSAMAANLAGLADYLSGPSVDPFGETCGRCKFWEPQRSWCERHSRPTIALDSCLDFENKLARQT